MNKSINFLKEEKKCVCTCMYACISMSSACAKNTGIYSVYIQYIFVFVCVSL